MSAAVVFDSFTAAASISPGLLETPTITAEENHPAHSAHSAHPDALRLRAVSLWCEGLRSPTIARQLDVPERTIRAWLADARADFHAEQGDTPHEMIALAVERQLAIAAAAWQSYHHAVALEQLALDAYRARVNRAATHKNYDELPPPPPRPSAVPARYLAVALAAQREAARLSGCYDRPGLAAQVTTAATTVAPVSTAPSMSTTPIPAKRQLSLPLPEWSRHRQRAFRQKRQPLPSTLPHRIPGSTSCEAHAHVYLSAQTRGLAHDDVGQLQAVGFFAT